MNKKLMLLALAVVSAAMLAIPAVASAEVAHISSVGKFTLTSEGGNSIKEEETVNPFFTCKTIMGTGEFTTTTTGKLQLLLHGCADVDFWHRLHQ
jgi:hypothetical protein